MRVLFALAACALFAAQAHADLCPRYAPPQAVGELDHALIDEASGIAFSRTGAPRLYHNNDSGDSGRFFVTDLDGGRTRVVNVRGLTPADMEDIAVGVCPEGTCVYLADIGDNAERRTNVTITVMRERANYSSTETPLRTITARYPDRAHDAESLAIAPNGDLYVITKPRDAATRRAFPAQVFRLRAAQLASTSEQTFELVGEIDLPYLLYDQGLAGQIATSFDIAPDGTRAILLTYSVAVEFRFDQNGAWRPSRTWRPNEDYRVIRTARLPQAEAIAYAPDGESIIYTTEFTDGFGSVPLYRATCDRAPRS